MQADIRLPDTNLAREGIAMGFSRIRLALTSGMIGAACMNSAGAQALRSGEQVYKEVCGACHTAGVANAPKLGDRKVWEPLISEGQAVLTAHAWVGVRGMPAARSFSRALMRASIMFFAATIRPRKKNAPGGRIANRKPG